MTGLFTVLTHFKYEKHQYTSFEFMAMNPPVSSKRLKPYQFKGETDAKNRPLNAVLSRSEWKVSAFDIPLQSFFRRSVKSDWSEQKNPSQLSRSL